MTISEKKSGKTREFLGEVLEKSSTDVAHLRRLEKERNHKARIKSAINKGKQTLLPSHSKAINLSKFEHNGQDGPLVVFTDELSYPFGNFGNYEVVKKYKSGGKTHNDSTRSTARKSSKIAKQRSGQMLNEKPKSEDGSAIGLTENSGFDAKNPFQKELKLPKLKSSSMKQEDDSCSESNPDSVSGLELSRNTELPRLPAQEYVDNFRKDAAEFERNLMGTGRVGARRQLLKGKARESILPRIDEKTTLFSTNTEKLLTKEDHFHLPKLQHKREEGTETVSKKKRKTRNGEQRRTTHQVTRRSMSHSERKTAAEKEQAKWCKMTMQSNAYI